MFLVRDECGISKEKCFKMMYSNLCINMFLRWMVRPNNTGVDFGI